MTNSTKLDSAIAILAKGAAETVSNSGLWFIGLGADWAHKDSLAIAFTRKESEILAAMSNEMVRVGEAPKSHKESCEAAFRLGKCIRTAKALPANGGVNGELILTGKALNEGIRKAIDSALAEARVKCDTARLTGNKTTIARSLVNRMATLKVAMESANDEDKPEKTLAFARLFTIEGLESFMADKVVAEKTTPPIPVGPVDSESLRLAAVEAAKAKEEAEAKAAEAEKAKAAAESVAKAKTAEADTAKAEAGVAKAEKALAESVAAEKAAEAAEAVAEVEKVKAESIPLPAVPDETTDELGMARAMADWRVKWQESATALAVAAYQAGIDGAGIADMWQTAQGIAETLVPMPAPKAKGKGKAKAAVTDLSDLGELYNA